MSSIPSVVIVGRMNVGKSSLFNRISRNTKSLVYDTEGVTRDVIKDQVSYGGTPFEIIDTGGIGVGKDDDPITAQVKRKAEEIVTTASIILFVCDGTVGLIPEEQQLAKWLHKLGRPVVVLINKTDVLATQEHLHEFDRLGFHAVFPISASHGRGVDEVLQYIVNHLDYTGEEIELVRSYKVVLLGKPNVGKSSLLNKLAEEERSIVTDIAGTTREPIAHPIEFEKQNFSFIDTAGVRRQRSVKEPLEDLMVKSSLDAVRRADLILLMVDCVEGELSDQELKLAFYAFDQGKALIILYNKIDIAEKYDRERLEYEKAEYKFFLKNIESINLSAKTGKNVHKVLPLVHAVIERYSKRFDEEEIEELLKQALIRKPLYHKKELLKLYRVLQLATGPIFIRLVVNQTHWFGPSQRSFFENLLRRTYNLKSVPVKFQLHKKK